MAAGQVTARANRVLVDKQWRSLQQPLIPNSCQSTLDQFLDLKKAFNATATIPQSLVTFNIGTILAFFIESKGDFKADIRQLLTVYVW